MALLTVLDQIEFCWSDGMRWMQDLDRKGKGDGMMVGSERRRNKLAWYLSVV